MCRVYPTDPPGVVGRRHFCPRGDCQAAIRKGVAKRTEMIKNCPGSCKQRGPNPVPQTRGAGYCYPTFRSPSLLISLFKEGDGGLVRGSRFFVREDLVKNASIMHTRYLHRDRFFPQNSDSHFHRGIPVLLTLSVVFQILRPYINLSFCYSASLFQGIGLLQIASHCF
jgi:hypothetical protein